MRFAHLLSRLPATLRGGDGGAHRDYWRHVVTLIGGTLGAQAIGIGSMLILARVYAPADFGGYALFFALSGLLALLASAKYDYAIFMARTAAEATHISLLATYLSVGFGLAVAAAAPFCVSLVGPATTSPLAFMLLLALATAAGGVTNSLTSWATQSKRFRDIATARVLQSITTALLGIGLGLTGWREMGLIIAFVAGQFPVIVMLAVRLAFIPHARDFTWRAARTRALRHIRYPKFLLLADGMNYVGANIVAFGTTALFGAASLGQYNLGQRVAGLPIGLVGTSMASVFRSAVSPQHISADRVPELFRATLIRLCAVGAVITVPLLVAAPLLFSIVLGSKWHEAGVYVQILSPLFFAKFVVSPLSVMLLLYRKQLLDTILQAMFIVAALAAIGIGAWSGRFIDALFALSAFHTVIYGVYLLISYRLAKGLSAR